MKKKNLVVEKRAIKSRRSQAKETQVITTPVLYVVPVAQLRGVF